MGIPCDLQERTGGSLRQDWPGGAVTHRQVAHQSDKSSLDSFMGNGSGEATAAADLTKKHIQPDKPVVLALKKRKRKLQ